MSVGKFVGFILSFTREQCFIVRVLMGVLDLLLVLFHVFAASCLIVCSIV